MQEGHNLTFWVKSEFYLYWKYGEQYEIKVIVHVSTQKYLHFYKGNKMLKNAKEIIAQIISAQLQKIQIQLFCIHTTFPYQTKVLYTKYLYSNFLLYNHFD